MALLGYPRGHRVNTETGCPLGTRLQAIRILTLEPEHLKNERPPPEKITRRWKGSHPRCSSGLQFKFLCVEVFSFFPKCQRNGCDLACQREPCHGWLDVFVQGGLIEILQWAGPCTRGDSGRFEQTFQIVVMVFIQAANGEQFLGAPQLAFDIAVFRADPGLQRQSAVGPQLPLGANRWGVWISATSSAERIGPIQGICRS